MITEELLKEFKDRMHIFHSGEDSNLEKLLSFSVAYIQSTCGEFDVNGEKNTDKKATELVFERSRYAYNDALEFFEDNFLSAIFSLGIELAGVEDEEV